MNPDDEAHETAVTATSEFDAVMLTTAWVLTEVADGLASPATRGTFAQVLRELKADPRVVIIQPNAALFDAGIELYEQRSDKDWSLTDCISFVAMREAGISDALTGDRHFEQAGFRALLK